MEAHAAKAAHLPLVERLVHGFAPAIWDVHIPCGIPEFFHLLQDLEPLHCPIVDNLRCRGEAPPTVWSPLLHRVRHVETGERVEVTRRGELVGHRVGTHEDHRARSSLHLVRLRVLGVVGLHLQGARLWAKEYDHHEPVPNELRLPLGDLQLVEGRGLLLRLSSSVQHGGAPVCHVKASAVDVGLHDVPYSCHGVIHGLQALALAARLVCQV
mmetsp:Transcript_43256/g.137576  ORF Transcript_43256/g.137576 Transcript_43256/m.137576 type:complete len:212 (-) Transcript_43256:333-968(-)